MKRLLIGAMAASCSSAFAADLPLLRPNRDVAIVYRVEGTAGAKGAPQSHTIRMFWGQDGEALRVELDAQPIVALVDFKHRRMAMLIGPRQVMVETKLDPALIPGFVLPAGAKAVRAGTDTVAGLGCAVWRMSGPRGSGTACVTDDGVVLRADGSAEHGSGDLEAVSVTYAPQPAALFAPPAGFARMDLQHPGR
jgi:hypothetical protein